MPTQYFLDGTDLVYDNTGAVHTLERIHYWIDTGKIVDAQAITDTGAAIYEECPATVRALCLERDCLIYLLQQADHAIAQGTSPLHDAVYLEKRLLTINATIKDLRAKVLRDLAGVEHLLTLTTSRNVIRQLCQQRARLEASLPMEFTGTVQYLTRGTNGRQTRMQPVVTIGGITQRGSILVEYVGWAVGALILGALCALLFGCTPYCGGW